MAKVNPEAVKKMFMDGMGVTEISRKLQITHSSVQYYTKGLKRPMAGDDYLKPVEQEPVRTEPQWGPNRLQEAKLPDCVLVLPDIQFPFHNPYALPWLAMVAQRYQPDRIIGIGDEIDAYCLSNFEKDPEIYEAGSEYERTLKLLDRLYELFPKVTALHSNHGRGRLEKARIRGGFLRGQVPDYQTFIKAPRGWSFHDEVMLGDVLFLHGDGERALSKPYLERHIPAEYGRHYSVVHGHRHEMCGRQAQAIVGEREYWAAYTGCLINPHHPAFGYTKGRKAKLGCGLIIHGEYKQLRLHLDDRGVWGGTI